jgi:hypothetical protein
MSRSPVDATGSGDHGTAGLGAAFGPASPVHQVCRAANDDPGPPWATMNEYSVGIVQV